MGRGHWRVGDYPKLARCCNLSVLVLLVYLLRLGLAEGIHVYDGVLPVVAIELLPRILYIWSKRKQKLVESIAWMCVCRSITASCCCQPKPLDMLSDICIERMAVYLQEEHCKLLLSGKDTGKLSDVCLERMAVYLQEGHPAAHQQRQRTVGRGSGPAVLRLMSSPPHHAPRNRSPLVCCRLLHVHQERKDARKSLCQQASSWETAYPAAATARYTNAYELVFHMVSSVERTLCSVITGC